MFLGLSLELELLVYSDRVPRGPISFAYKNVSTFDPERFGESGADAVFVDLEGADLDSAQLAKLKSALSNPELPKSGKITPLGFFLPRGAERGTAGAFLR